MSAIKAIGEDRFGGYGVLFGNASQKDTQNEYFTDKTDYALGWYDKRPALYHHGQDKTLQSQPVGIIDTIKADNVGLWIEGQWDKANQYLDAVKQLVKAGKLGWSSGTLNYLKKVDPDGRITRWPIAEISMTTSPAEPRATGVSMKHYAEPETVTAAFKSIGITPNLDALQETDSSTAQNSGAIGDDVPTVPDTKAQEDTIMEITQEQLQEMLNKASEAGASKALATIPAQPTTPEPTPAAIAFANSPDRLSAVIKSGGVAPQPGENRITVTRATKYSGMTPVQMEIFHTIKASRGRTLPVEFYREYAAKTIKSMDSGAIDYDGDFVKAAGSDFKSNELNYSTYTSYGDEYVPTGTSSELWRKVRQENKILSLFAKIEMPTNPYDITAEGADPVVYKVPETSDQNKTASSSTNYTASKVGTAKVTLTATKAGIQIYISDELNEDGIHNFVALAEEKSMKAFQNVFDYLIVNGDKDTSATTNINAIDTTPAATDKFLIVNGLRKYGLITNTAQKLSASGAAVSVDLLRQAQALLGTEYMNDNENLCLIVDDWTFHKMKSMPEYATMDKFGEMAVNKTGKVSLFDGIPVYPTAELGKTRTDGKTHSAGTGNSYGSAILAHRSAFKFGYRRNVRMSVDHLGYSDSTVLTMSARVDFCSTFDTDAAVVLYYLGV